ncbi:MAG: hypothetical protein ACXWMI_08525, partial [Syntrophales bacterium]
RRITVKKAILNLRLADRYLCDINCSAALKNFKSARRYEVILRIEKERLLIITVSFQQGHFSH